MNLLIKKEIRLILPGWITAMVLSWIPLMIQALKKDGGLYQPVDPSCIVCYCAAALLLGITTFGMEVSHGTFGLLLSHPIARKTLWRVKMSVLTIGFLLTWLGPLFFFSICRDANTMFYAFTVAAMLMGVSGGLWTTLAFRNVAAFFWIALIIPLALLATSALVNLSEDSSLAKHYPDIVLSIFLLYSFFSLWFARRLFYRAQEIALAGYNVSFSVNTNWLAFPSRLFLKGPMVSLIRKELGLHQMIIVCGIVLFAIQLIIILATWQFHWESGQIWHLIAGGMSLVWAFIPIFIGAMAVAEERRMNTLIGTLCLPIPKWKQIGIKFLVVFLLSLILGVVMPFTMSWLTNHVANLHDFNLAEGWSSLIPLTLLAIGTTLLFFFASTLASSFLHALGIGIALLVAGMLLLLGTRDSGPNWKELNLFAPLFWLIGFVIIFLWFSFKNFAEERITHSVWIRNISAILGIIVGGTVLAGLTYWRTWEFVISGEPRHGKAELSGPVDPQIISRWGINVVLLPDGRLWATDKMKTAAFLNTSTPGKEKGGTNYISFSPISPVSGTFLEGTNWVKIAADFRSIVGIKSDGTLWLIKSNFIRETQASIRKTTISDNTKSPLRLLYHLHSVKTPFYTMNYAPEKIGTDSNWKTVEAHGDFFLALKKDGTLWGWGHNTTCVLGNAPENVTNGPIQINSETNWISIFTFYTTCAAVKKDGTVWLWGDLPFAPPQYKSNKPWYHPRPEPVCYPLKGTNWTQIGFYNECLIGIDGSGTMWGIGKLHFLRGVTSPEDIFQNTPTQIGMPGEWRQFANAHFLKKNGTLWRNDSDTQQIRRISHYSDWITTDIGTIENSSLASDGTLTSWSPNGDNDEWLPSILCNSRNPGWSINILKSVKTQASAK